MLGLVVGPGVVLGVGLVVAGVSVPVPPLLEPPLDSVPEPEEPELPFSGMLLPDVPLDVSDLPEPEPPPVMPAHALSSMAHARGIIHFVINHSCKDKKSGTRNKGTDECMLMQEIESVRSVKFWLVLI